MKTKYQEPQGLPYGQYFKLIVQANKDQHQTEALYFAPHHREHDVQRAIYYAEESYSSHVDLLELHVLMPMLWENFRVPKLNQNEVLELNLLVIDPDTESLFPSTYTLSGEIQEKYSVFDAEMLYEACADINGSSHVQLLDYQVHYQVQMDAVEGEIPVKELQVV